VYPDDFAWRPDQWIDTLTGSDHVRTSVDSGRGIDEIVAGWQAGLRSFRALRDRYLIYRDRGGPR
jgi:uncharacterized protein YbbC (DUF1343 family)